MKRWEVAVIGGGPAGWVAAVSMAEAGFSTQLIDPDPRAAWPNNYGAWRDELDDYAHLAEHGWPRAEVWLDPDVCHVLERPYVRLDNARLQAHLQERGASAGLEVTTGRVEGAEHDADGSRLALAEAPAVDARLLIDASGHRPVLVEPGRGREPGVQVAYGVQARLQKGAADPSRMVLMDFRSAHLPPAEREPPTFLYEMPLDDGRVFVEETSLVARPPLNIDICQRRLTRRLEARDWQLGPAEEVERCFIPMGGPLPRADQRVVPFGGAATLVHPATGYMIANVLKMGPRIADAVSAVRHRREAERWARAAWSAVWPTDRRVAWLLYRYGMEVLLEMGVSGTSEFFATFFSCAPIDWRRYLSGDASSRAVATAMLNLFLRASPKLRWQLATKGFNALMPRSPA